MSRVPISEAGHSGDHICSIPLEPRLGGTMPLSFPLSQLHIHAWYGSAFADTTYILSEKCPTKCTGIHPHPQKRPVLYQPSCTIFQGPHIPLMAFTSCYNPGSNLEPLDERAANPTCRRTSSFARGDDHFPFLLLFSRTLFTPGTI